MAFCSWCSVKKKKKDLTDVTESPTGAEGKVCVDCLEEEAERAGSEYRYYQRLADEAHRNGAC